MKHGERKPFVYRSPAGRLVDRFANLERHRQHVTRELRLIEKLVAEYPELRKSIPASANTRKLWLVVDNSPGRGVVTADGGNGLPAL
jgi:hypothetical protein